MSIRPAVWLVGAGVVVADFLTKQWALHALEVGVNRPLWGGFFSLQLVFNDGAALSIGAGHTWLLTLVALVVTAGIVMYARRATTTFTAVLLGFALGGAVGNLVDRLFRAPSFGQGHVVDMINYNGWFVGNVADIAIVGAAVAFVVVGLIRRDLLTPLVGEHEASTQDAPAMTDEAPTDRD